MGSSGVGKSTFLNRLAGSELARAGAVREKDGKGRHTTTHRELFRLDGGALVIESMEHLLAWVGASRAPAPTRPWRRKRAPLAGLSTAARSSCASVDAASPRRVDVHPPFQRPRWRARVRTHC